MSAAPICPYCQTRSVLVTGKDIYPRRPDLWSKVIYRRPRCPDAYVGCHPGTETPLGRLADGYLRRAKGRAHAAFDPMWFGKGKRERGAAYAWLARELAIDAKYVHIGMMDVDCCERVVEICALARQTENFNFGMELT